MAISDTITLIIRPIQTFPKGLPSEGLAFVDLAGLCRHTSETNETLMNFSGDTGSCVTPVVQPKIKTLYTGSLTVTFHSAPLLQM